MRGYDSGVQPKLEVRNLVVELATRRGWVRPVAGVSLTLRAGETLGIVGESGSGKTLLCLALMGLLPPGARCLGEAWLHTEDRGNGVAEQVQNIATAFPAAMRRLRGREIAMIFQEPMTALNPVMRIGAQVAEAIHVHELKLGRKELRHRVQDALKRAAVPDPERRARQYPHELSGGLRQRALIAMALAASPSLLIADEPTTALDVTVQKQILDLLDELRRELRLSILLITHDLGVIAQLAGRLAVMYAGRIVEEGPAAEVLEAPQHPYTAALLRATPRMGAGKLRPIPGAVPALDTLPRGCAFGPRCERHVAACDRAIPELISAAGANETHRARCILMQ